MRAGTKARQSERKAPLVRGEPVVRGVLEAALEELARVGYAALRIEDVSARAGVNKTTVYRRWPTKEDLIRAALLSITTDRFVAPNTGSLRGDLLSIARSMVTMSCSAEGQGIIRIFIAEGLDSELMSIARSVKKIHEAVPRSVIAAAQARGELAPGVEAMLVFDVLAAALNRKLMMDREVVDEAFLGRLVDLLLHGALASTERARPRAARAGSAGSAGRRGALRPKRAGS